MTGSLGERAAVWTLLVTLATVAVYAAGWLYASRFFEPFGVGLGALDLPKEHILIHGGRVFADQARWFVLPALVVGITWRLTPPGALATLAGILGPAGRLALPALVVALAAGGYVGLGMLAEDTADRYRMAERDAGFITRPAVQVWFEMGKGSEPLRDALAQGCHRLLYRAKDALVLIRPVRDVPEATLTALVVPVAGVSGFRLLNDHAPCL